MLPRSSDGNPERKSLGVPIGIANHEPDFESNRIPVPPAKRKPKCKSVNVAKRGPFIVAFVIAECKSKCKPERESVHVAEREPEREPKHEPFRVAVVVAERIAEHKPERMAF